MAVAFWAGGKVLLKTEAGSSYIGRTVLHKNGRDVRSLGKRDGDSWVGVRNRGGCVVLTRLHPIKCGQSEAFKALLSRNIMTRLRK